MPKYELIAQPQFPILTIDTDDIIQFHQILNLLNDSNKTTLCIRSKNGHPNRGGYFFCISKRHHDTYHLETLEGITVADLSSKQLTTLINHVSGKKFDPDMLEYCQNIINFRSDV